MASRLQDVIIRGLAADKPLATLVAPGTLYFSSDTSELERSDGTVWESYGGGGGSTLPTAPLGQVLISQGAGIDPILSPSIQVNDILATSVDASSGSVIGGILKTGSVIQFDEIDFSSLPIGESIGTIATINDSPVQTIGSPVTVGGGTFHVFVRWDGTNWIVIAGPRIASIGMIIDGGASVISVGLKGFLEVPFACTILGVTLLADVSGSIVVDIWKSTYAAFPPVVGGSITAAAKPTISGTVKSQNTTLTGWNTAIVEGDVLAFNVDSVATIKKVTLSLKVQVP